MIYNWKQEINKLELKKVGEELRKDNLVVFPTETVYGIGANAFSKEAIEKIYLAKKRPSDNPLIVHLATKEDICKIAKDINEIEQKLINTFMPGPFTIILNRTKEIPNVVTANLDTVAVRVPENKIAQEIIKEAGVPIAAPSANISGRPSGTNIDDIKEELEENVSIIVEADPCTIGLESTVVKVINNIPVILRPGKVTKEDIQKVVGVCKIDENVLKQVGDFDKVESPGMKYKHYAPNTDCRLIYSNDEAKLINEINSQIKNIQIINNKIKKIGVIGFCEHKDKIKADNFLEICNVNDLDKYAREIYSALRKMDKEGLDLILIEGVGKQEIGLAIMNRLIRTCRYDVIMIK